MTARLVCGGKSGQLLGTERCSTGTYLETITLEVVIRVCTHISCVRPVVRSGTTKPLMPFKHMYSRWYLCNRDRSLAHRHPDTLFENDY